MTSIVVSSDDLRVAQIVGQEAADALGYRHVGRELLEQVAAERDVPVDKLHRVLEGTSTSRWSRKSRELLLSYIETAALDELVKDDIVCTGLGAHLYARDVSHLLTVRVLADPGARARELATREKITPQKAWKKLAQEDQRRTRWSVEHFGLDEIAASIYDLVISLSPIESDKAVEIIRDMASYRKLRPMTYSRKVLHDLAVASRVRSLLLPQFPDIQVAADGDTAMVWVKCSPRHKQKIAATIKELAGAVPDVELVEVHAVSSLRKLAERDSATAR